MEIEAKVKDDQSKYFFEIRVGYEFLPFLRERGDFCSLDSDKCTKGIIRYHNKRVMPSFISPGKYMFKTLVYNESKIPLSCRWFNFEYTDVGDDDEIDIRQNTTKLNQK